MTVSIKSPTSTTGSIQLNGSDVLTIDSSGNLTAPNALTVTGSISTSGTIPAGQLTGALPAIDGSALTNLPAGAEVGSIIIMSTSTVPANYLECNGATISRTTYANLFGVIGENYGAGDGSTTFTIPDLRGEFIRGWDNSAGVDPDAGSRTDRGDGTSGDVVGSKQADEIKSHRHIIASHYATGNGIYTTSSTGYSRVNYSNYFGGNESRPVNVAMMYCIRY